MQHFRKSLLSSLSTLTLLTIALTLTACSEKPPEETTPGEETSAPASVVAPSCSSTPAPSRCTETTPTFGRATRITKMEIGGGTKPIKFGNTTIRNGLKLLSDAAAKYTNKVDLNKSINDAIAANKFQLVVEYPEWKPTENDPPADPKGIYLWLGKDLSGTDIKIDPRSVDQGSYPKGVIGDISYEKSGTSIAIKTNKPQKSSMRFSLAGIDFSVDILGATLNGIVEPKADGIELKRTQIKAAIVADSFKSGITEIVKKCPASCYQVDDTKHTCSVIAASAAQCKTDIAALSDPKLKTACEKLSGFCSESSSKGIDFFSDSYKDGTNETKVVGAVFNLEGTPVKITGIAP